jgi:two-component system phosphate regulon sensor histidine kinase PhoR
MNKPNTFPWHFFYNSAKFQGFVLAVSILSTIFTYRYYIKKGFTLQIQDEVKVSLETIRDSFQSSNIDILKWCKSIPNNSSVRYTLMSQSGEVLCETNPNVDRTQNHANRPEFKAALKGETKTLKRYSKSLKKNMIYGATQVQVNNEIAVLRRAVPIEKLHTSINWLDKSILLATPLLFLFIYLVLLWSMLNISRPINKVLNQIASMERKMPFHVKLKLLYKRDEWTQIYEALKQAEENIQKQLNQINDENEKTATLLDSITDAVFAVDIHQSSLFYNKKFEDKFFNDEVIVTEEIKLWKVFDKKKILKAYERAMTKGQSKRLRGREFKESNSYYDISVTPLFNRKKEIIGAVGVFHDVTDAFLTEQMRVDFVANVSHEIRTPLTSIKGFAQMLESEKEKLDPKLQPFIDKILLNSERLHSLFNDLLNLSVIESQNEISIEKINLEKMFSGIKDSLQTNYSHKKIVIVSDLQVKEVDADKKLFEQAIINLVDNACKYTYKESEIKVSSFEEDNGVVISVSDKGPGISSEHLKRIFERFYRVDHDRARQSGGTGLGLSIVKHIINKHGGQVWAQSEPKEGTIFFIKIPKVS